MEANKSGDNSADRAAAPMTESEFHERVDALLQTIEAAADNAECDIDSEFNGGVLTLTFENNTKIIVNRQTPMREFWVAAKSGGFHFRYVVETSNTIGNTSSRGAWKDTRSQEQLASLLSRVMSEQSANVISITFD